MRLAIRSDRQKTAVRRLVATAQRPGIRARSKRLGNGYTIMLSIIIGLSIPGTSLAWKLDDGWPESEKDVFQASLSMVVVKNSR